MATEKLTEWQLFDRRIARERQSEILLNTVLNEIALETNDVPKKSEIERRYELYKSQKKWLHKPADHQERYNLYKKAWSHLKRVSYSEFMKLWVIEAWQTGLLRIEH